MTDLRTIPSMYHAQLGRLGNRVSTYHKDPTTRAWVATTRTDAHEVVRGIACGLMSLGVEAGDRVGVLSDTCIQWTSADLGIVCAAGVTVGLYPTSTAEQCAYILDHAGVAVVFVENRSQLRKLKSVAGSVPTLRRFIVFDETEPGPADPDVMTLSDLLALGEKAAIRDSASRRTCEAYDARWQGVKPDDLAMLVYTSGTTGPPKGVMLTHRNIVATVDAVNAAIPLRDDDLGIVFLPLAHSLQRTSNYAAMEAGTTGVFAERIEKLGEHMQEFRPTVQVAVPRVYEKIYQRVLSKVAEQPPRRQAIFRWAVDVGKQVRALERAGSPVPLLLRGQFEVAERLVLSRIRDRFGGRLRFMVSGAAPISKEILEFFDAIGIVILEGWGLTETSGPATVNRRERVRFGTVGQDLACCESKIAEDGEILVRGANVFRGYFRDEDATRAAFTDDGWFRTGDIGSKDRDGFLTITDRKKELIITGGGKNISPSNLENLVKANPLVSQCVVIGDNRKYLVALLALDPEALTELARRRGITGDPAALSRHPKVVGEVQLILDGVNRGLARYETIKYFRILEKELSVEDDLLTPTLKLKRRNITARYQTLIDEMYAVPTERKESLW